MRIWKRMEKLNNRKKRIRTRMTAGGRGSGEATRGTDERNRLQEQITGTE